MESYGGFFGVFLYLRQVYYIDVKKRKKKKSHVDFQAKKQQQKLILENRLKCFSPDTTHMACFGTLH